MLDLGCGNGAKLAELAGRGASGVGVDVSGNFVESAPSGVELVRGDLNELDSMPELPGRTFDRILFLQSFEPGRSTSVIISPYATCCAREPISATSTPP
ncbi:class I SAM-dependent methyltransferase [Nocardioides sp.]|uniref:class I SAM-dependent methyltransferase n=1 Tax=Nocardioides sp. TaxID=35761 RepID=UPI002ED83CE1